MPYKNVRIHNVHVYIWLVSYPVFDVLFTVRFNDASFAVVHFHFQSVRQDEASDALHPLQRRSATCSTSYIFTCSGVHKMLFLVSTVIALPHCTYMYRILNFDKYRQFPHIRSHVITCPCMAICYPI